MRVAALSDVHGNLPALEAVLADVARERVDEIVVCGDVLWGPFQEECLVLLRDVGARALAGNCERDVLHGSTDRDTWCRERLGAAARAEVQGWPATIRLDVDGVGRVLFCHATPSSDTAIVTRITPDDAVAEAVGESVAEVVVCGHTHVQFDRQLPGGTRLVNAGSVGLAYEDEPGARWALIGPDVVLCRTAYDTEAAAAAIVSSGFPQADDLFGASLRGEIAAASATEHFEEQRGA